MGVFKRLFLKSCSKMINKFTREFANDFYKDSGEIDWKKLVHFNSAINIPKKAFKSPLCQ
ncbi:MAG: hypothetical protein EPN39_16105 [Chitinophagaceae bacterium]|nr:MAG: hypothetical protein EPN39_16105 [Chitinophagaceae bacterium]